MTESGAGLPQLDWTFYPGQLFWLVISFAILYFVVSRLALPSIQATQDKRRCRIRDDIAEAQAGNAMAAELKTAYEASLTAARAEAMTALDEMTAAMARESATQREQHILALNSQVREAEAKIAAARTAALGEAKVAAQDLAAAITARILDTGTTATVAFNGGGRS